MTDDTTATYCIVVKHDPTAVHEANRYRAAIWRIADETYLDCVFGDTHEVALEAAQEYVARANRADEPVTYHADDKGRIVNLHSVKA